MKCEVCGAEFTPDEGQEDAYWAVNWYTQGWGKLCPPCHEAAKELNAVSSTKLLLGGCPWLSEIMDKRKDLEKRRAMSPAEIKAEKEEEIRKEKEEKKRREESHTNHVVYMMMHGRGNHWW